MIEPLKPKQSLKIAELQDGDIICFQRVTERKGDSPRPVDKTGQEPYVYPASGHMILTALTLHSAPASDRFEDAREYYDFLEHRRTVKFLPHPTRCVENAFTSFDLVLNSKINYDAVSEKVAAQLGVPATHIRFWTVNATTNNPKAPVRRGTNPTLRQILNPMGTNSLSTTQRGDAFYLELLEMSLAELDTKKSIKLVFLSDGITKEVSL